EGGGVNPLEYRGRNHESRCLLPRGSRRPAAEVIRDGCRNRNNERASGEVAEHAPKPLPFGPKLLSESADGDEVGPLPTGDRVCPGGGHDEEIVDAPVELVRI